VNPNDARIQATLLRSLTGIALLSVLVAAPVTAQPIVTKTELPYFDDPCSNMVASSSVKMSLTGKYITYTPALFDFYAQGCPEPGFPRLFDVPRHAYSFGTLSAQVFRPTPNDDLPARDSRTAVTSDDGRYIAFRGSLESDAQNRAVFLLDTQTNSVSEIYADAGVLRWHSDQKHLLFQSSDGDQRLHHAYNVENSELTTRSLDPLPQNYYSSRVAHSNDDEFILYASREQQLYVQDLQTQQVRRIDTTVAGTEVAVSPRGELSLSRTGRYATWFADLPNDQGSLPIRSLIWSDLERNRHVVVPGGEYVLNARISGDGRYVAFAQVPYRVDSDYDPRYAYYRGIALYDSVDGLSHVIEEQACDQAFSHSFSQDSCDNTGEVVAISDDGLSIVYMTWMKPVLLQVSDTETELRYSDVSDSFWAKDAIDRLDNAGIAGQCNQSPREFCPQNALRHDVSAQWLVKAVKGADYQPTPGTGSRFTDVSINSWAVDWVEEIDRLRIDRGFGASFRPEASLTRAQFALFLVRARYGADYSPPVATGQEFDDVPSTHWAAPYIEQLRRDGIVVNGCNGSRTSFCPTKTLNRAVAAVLLSRAFDL